MRTRRLLVLFAALAAALPARAFVAFESGPVRPVALSPDGTRLFVANIPDGRLEIFAVGDGGLTHVAASRAAAGGWKGAVDAETLIRKVYADRLIDSRPVPRL